METSKCARCGIIPNCKAKMRFTSKLERSDSTIRAALQEIFGKFQDSVPFLPVKAGTPEKNLCRSCGLKLTALHKAWNTFLPAPESTCYINEELMSIKPKCFCMTQSICDDHNYNYSTTEYESGMDFDQLELKTPIIDSEAMNPLNRSSTSSPATTVSSPVTNKPKISSSLALPTLTPSASCKDVPIGVAGKPKTMPPLANTARTVIQPDKIVAGSSAPACAVQPASLVVASKVLPSVGYSNQEDQEKPKHCGICAANIEGKSISMNFKLKRYNKEEVEMWLQTFFKFNPKYYKTGENIGICYTCTHILTTTGRIYQNFLSRVHKDGLVAPRIPWPAQSKEVRDQQRYEERKQHLAYFAPVPVQVRNRGVAPQTEKKVVQRPLVPVGASMKAAEKTVKGKQVLANHFRRMLHEEMRSVCKYSSLASQTSTLDYKLPAHDDIFDELEAFAPTVLAALYGLTLNNYKVVPSEKQLNPIVTILSVAMNQRSKFCNLFQKGLGYLLWNEGCSVKSFQHCHELGLSPSRKTMLGDIDKRYQVAVLADAAEDNDQNQNASDSDVEMASDSDSPETTPTESAAVPSRSSSSAYLATTTVKPIPLAKKRNKTLKLARFNAIKEEIKAAQISRKRKI